MSIEDIRTYKVSDKLQLLLFILCCINYKPQSIIVLALLYALNIIFYKLIAEFIGGADIKIFLSLLLVLGQNLIEVILIASLTAMCFCIILKKQKIYFVPFITFGYLCVISILT